MHTEKKHINTNIDKVTALYKLLRLHTITMSKMEFPGIFMKSYLPHLFLSDSTW